MLPEIEHANSVRDRHSLEDVARTSAQRGCGAAFWVPDIRELCSETGSGSVRRATHHGAACIWYESERLHASAQPADGHRQPVGREREHVHLGAVRSVFKGGDFPLLRHLGRTVSHDDAKGGEGT